MTGAMLVGGGVVLALSNVGCKLSSKVCVRLEGKTCARLIYAHARSVGLAWGTGRT